MHLTGAKSLPNLKKEIIADNNLFFSNFKVPIIVSILKYITKTNFILMPIEH